MIRYLFGFSGDALINGATTAEAQRSPPDEIQAYLEPPKEMLDIEGNGSVTCRGLMPTHKAGMALSARARVV